MSRLIDADQLEDVVTKANEQGFDITRYEFKRIELVLFEFPTVEAEPVRHGHWVESSEDGTLFCSECGRPTYDTHDEFKEFMGTKIIALVYPYYCGYCGAKMGGGNL